MTKDEQKNCIYEASKLGLAAWVCISVGNGYMEDSIELLDKLHLNVHELKWLTGNYTKAFDRLDTRLQKCFDRGIKEAEMEAGALDEFRTFCNNYLLEREKKENWNWKQRYLFEHCRIERAQELYDRNFRDIKKAFEDYEKQLAVKDDEILRLKEQVAKLKSKAQDDKPTTTKKQKQFTQTIHLQ